MKVRIEIDTKTFIRFILVVVGFALAALAIYSARTALLIIGISFFLALALSVPVGRLVKLLPGKNRAIATTLSYIVVVAVLGAVVFWVIPPIVQQTAKFIQTTPEIANSMTEQWQGLNDLVDKHNLRDQVDQTVESIKDSAAGWTANAGQAVISGIGSVFSFVTILILVLVITFLMIIEGPKWNERVWKLYTDHGKMERHRRVAEKMHDVVTQYVSGQVTVSAIGAVAAGLAVFIISFIFPDVSASLAMPTAAITFVLTLIPMFGATIAGIIVGLLLAFNNLPAAIVYVIFFIIYQQIENNLIAPVIQSKKIELSPLAVLVAVTIGVYMFGVIGGIIAIPIAGCVRVLIQEHLENAAEKRKESRRPLAKIVKKLKEVDK